MVRLIKTRLYIAQRLETHNWLKTKHENPALRSSPPPQHFNEQQQFSSSCHAIYNPRKQTPWRPRSIWCTSGHTNKQHPHNHSERKLTSFSLLLGSTVPGLIYTVWSISGVILKYWMAWAMKLKRSNTNAILKKSIRGKLAIFKSDRCSPTSRRQ